MEFTNTLYTQLDSKETTRLQADLDEYIDQLTTIVTKKNYSDAESFLHLPFDQSISLQISSTIQNLTDTSPEYIFIIGIGGSYLGAKSVYDAFWGTTDLLNSHRFPKLVFLDTCNPEMLNHAISILDSYVKKPEKIVIVLISKSGTTMESLVNFEILTQNFTAWEDRTIVISSKNTPLETWASSHHLKYLTQPEKVGGRYSIFSTTGLLPLSFLPKNIEQLQEGARHLTNEFLSDKSNHAISKNAITLYHYYQNGYTIHELFTFTPQLETLGKWYRQLFAESLGKIDPQGNVIEYFPIPSVGTVDLHSMEQLTLNSPSKVITTFILPKINTSLMIPSITKLDYEVTSLGSKSVATIMESIYQGVLESRRHYQVPYMEIHLSDLSYNELGNLLQSMMIQTILLARLFKINAFNQPCVELYKQKTRELLNH